MSDLPRIHPRTRMLGEATGRLGMAVAEVAREYELTPAELLTALAGIMQGYAASAVKHERGISQDEEG